MPELKIQLPDDLGAVPAEVTSTLADVRALLTEIRGRMDADSRLAVSAKEAAAMLGCSDRTLQNHSVPSFQIGGRRLYSLATLREWIREQEAVKP